MIKQFFYFTLISISISLVGAQQAQEEQKVEEVELPPDHTASHALHGIIDNNLPSEVVQLIGKFMGGYTKINILKPERPFFSHRPLNIEEQVNLLSLAPDGIHLASASEDEEKIRIWNSDTGKCIQESTGTRRPNSIRWYQHELLASEPAYQYYMVNIKWSPNGRQLTSSGHSTVHVYTESDRYIQIEQPSNLHIPYIDHIQTLEHEGLEDSWGPWGKPMVKSISWLSDNELITTYDNKIIKWNPNTGERLAVFEDPDGIVYTAQGSPKGNFIASYGKTVRILEAKSGKLLEVIPKTCLPLHWLSEDLLAVTLEQENSALSNLDEWSPSNDSVIRFTDPVPSAKWHPLWDRSEDAYTLSLMKRRRMGIFNRQSKEYYVLGGEYSTEMNDHRNSIHVRSVFENGTFTSIDSSQAGRIVAGCSEGKISVWDPASKYLVELCDPEMRKQLQAMRTPAARAIKALQKMPGIKTLTEACVIQ